MPNDFDHAPLPASFQSSPTNDATPLNADDDSADFGAYRSSYLARSLAAEALSAYNAEPLPMVCLESSWAELAADADLAADLRREFGTRGLALIAKTEAAIDEAEEHERTLEAQQELKTYRHRATKEAA